MPSLQTQIIPHRRWMLFINTTIRTLDKQGWMPI
jgi:hypothetical protein